MRIFKTKLYRVDYKGTHGGGVDHIRGRVLLENYPWIIEAHIPSRAPDRIFFHRTVRLFPGGKSDN